jgi:hypothetical protein
MKKTGLLIALCMAVGGCVLGSVSPYYTDDLVVKQPQFYGYWYFSKEAEPDEKSPIILDEGKITTYDVDGKPADAKLTFFKVDGVLFADIFPDQGELKEQTAGNNPPVHLLSRIDVLGPDKVSFNALDYEWLSKQVQTGAVGLPYKKDAEVESDIIFTASSQQWVEFLRRHKDDPKAFPRDSEAPLVRGKPPK